MLLVTLTIQYAETWSNFYLGRDPTENQNTETVMAATHEWLDFKCAFLWFYLMVFDGVFCILSTKEVSRSGLILPNCITLFLFLFLCCSLLLCPGTRRVPNTRVPNYVWWLFSSSICCFLMGFFAFFQQQKLADVNLNLSILKSCVLCWSGHFSYPPSFGEGADPSKTWLPDYDFFGHFFFQNEVLWYF